MKSLSANNLYATRQDRAPLVIVAFGDSTTAPNESVKKVYSVRLEKILTTAGMDNRVINAGIGGSHTGSYKDNDLYRIAHGMDRFHMAVLSHHPDWVTLNFGINDSWQYDGNNGASTIPIDQYRQNLIFFTDMISGGGGKVILLTPNPIGKGYKGYHERRLKEYMMVIRELAETKKIPLIDTWKVFDRYRHKNPDGIDALLLDGMHPNDAGHKLIATEIAKIIIGSSNKINIKN